MSSDLQARGPRERYLEQKEALQKLSNIDIAERYFHLQPSQRFSRQNRYRAGNTTVAVDQVRPDQPFYSVDESTLFNGSSRGFGPISLFQALVDLTQTELHPGDFEKRRGYYETKDPQKNGFRRAFRCMLEAFRPELLSDQDINQPHISIREFRPVDPREIERMRRAEASARYHQQRAALDSLSCIDIAEGFFGLQPVHRYSGENQYDIGSARIGIDKRKATQPFLSLRGDLLYNGKTGGHGPISLFRALADLSGMQLIPADYSERSNYYETGNADQDDYRKAFRCMLEAFRPDLLPSNAPKPKGQPPAVPVRSLDLSRMDESGPHKETPFALPPKDNHVEPQVRDYLVERRKLPAKLVDAMLQANAVYPVMRKQEMTRKDGETWTKTTPAALFPLRGYQTNQVVGYASIDLDAGNFRQNRGQIQQAHFSVGRYNENTKKVVLTEAVIDACSKFALDQPSKGTVIQAMAGSRVPGALLEQAEKNQTHIVLAQDADRAGRKTARNVYEECKTRGIPVSVDMPKGAIVDFRIDHSPRDWEERVEKCKAMAGDSGIPYSVAANKDGTSTSVFMPSNVESDRIIDAIKNEYRQVDLQNRDQMRETFARLHGMKKLPKKVPVLQDKAIMKDWNDVLRFRHSMEEHPHLPPHAHVPGLPEHFQAFPYPEGERWGLSAPAAQPELAPQRPREDGVSVEM